MIKLKKACRKARKTILIVLLSGVMIFALLLGLMTIMTPTLPGYERCEMIHKTGRHIPSGKTLTILTWNIGYAGLGREMDFFYEGGTGVRPTELMFRKYFSGIMKLLHANDSLDFIYVQEADTWSKRSYFTDEVKEIGEVLKGHGYAFAKNYDSWFVPLPLAHPMGHVVSGIVTFSAYDPEEAERIGFGTHFSWPKQLFLLQRCLLVLRFRVEGGKELVLINTHNSTFDKGGELRKTELQKIASYADAEYRKGNFVLVGGDWNNNPVGFDKEKIISGDCVKTIDPLITSTFLSGWQFANDPEKPTNRDVDAPYKKGKTLTTIIDFFVVSPNIEVVSVNTIPSGFRDSDHQPVVMKLRLSE
jgi:endonuclease/exonuclease/phosphatase family metal-dependent hydrolase